MKLNRKQWVLVIVLILLFFPEFDNYSTRYNSKIEQWQFGSLHYMVYEDCFNGMTATTKQSLTFKSFFTRADVEWGDCDDDFYSGRAGISFAIKDPFYTGYSIVGIHIRENFGAISIIDKLFPTIWLWE